MAEPWQALDAIGLLPDIEIDPAIAALQLARLDSPLADWHAASAHLSELAREAAGIGAVLSGRSAEARVGALAGLIHARFGYRGDSETYDDLDNANLIRVIERRRGLPVALGILWLHCIRAAGWDGHGIDFPGHFLVALAAPASDGPAERPARTRRWPPACSGRCAAATCCCACSATWCSVAAAPERRRRRCYRYRACCASRRTRPGTG